MTDTLSNVLAMALNINSLVYSSKEDAKHPSISINMGFDNNGTPRIPPSQHIWSITAASSVQCKIVISLLYISIIVWYISTVEQLYIVHYSSLFQYCF